MQCHNCNDREYRVSCTQGCRLCECCIHQIVGRYYPDMKCPQPDCSGFMCNRNTKEWCKCCPIGVAPDKYD